MTQELERWAPLVDFLGASLGDNYEVFLYDLRKKKHPIIAIANGQLSGRRVGSLMKNVIVKMLDTKEATGDTLIRRDAVSRDGSQFKSSTMLIRNSKGEPIGALCINFKVNAILDFKNFLSSLGEDLSSIQPIDLSRVMFAGEVFPDNHTATLESIFNHCMDILGELDFSSPRERQRMVDQFYRAGGFQQKGAVPFLAEQIGISEPTVYRYYANAKHRLEKEKK